MFLHLCVEADLREGKECGTDEDNRSVGWVIERPQRGWGLVRLSVEVLMSKTTIWFLF